MVAIVGVRVFEHSVAEWSQERNQFIPRHQDSMLGTAILYPELTLFVVIVVAVVVGAILDVVVAAIVVVAVVVVVVVSLRTFCLCC